LKTTNTYLHPDAFHRKSRETRRAPDLPVERFDHRIGLTSLQVHSTVISDDGRLWGATPAGLVCYDGVRARIYGRKDGLANHGLRALAIHPSTGELWIGTDLGIEILDISQGKPKPLWTNALGTVNALGLQSDSVMVGSSQGLFRRTGKKTFSKVKALNAANDTIGKIFSHSDGSYWLTGSATGLIHLSGKGQKLPIGSAHQKIGEPISFAQGPEGSILIGGTNGFCRTDANGQVKAFRPSSTPIIAQYWDRDKIWVSSNQTISSFPANFDANEKPKVHLQNVVVKHIQGDRFDNIWLSTSGQALLKISNFRNTFVEDFPTETGHILSIFSDTSGRLIGGSAGLVLPNGAVILDNLEIWDVLRDETGKIWSATDKGLYCTPHSQWSFHYNSESCPVIQAPCRALKVFKKRLYVASIRGLARLNPEGAEEVLDPAGKSFGYVYSLHEGPDGFLWIATLGQDLFRFDGQKITPVELPDEAKNANVYALTHDKCGRLYAAHDNYISRIDSDGSFTALFESPSSVAAWSLGWMKGGNLVAGSAAGLIIFNDETGQIKHRIAGNFEDVPWEFTTSRSLDIQDHKTLLCGLGSGLRTVVLNELIPRNEAPEARLADITCSGSEFQLEDNTIRITAGKWRLIIEISTEWFLDNCQMRYRLKEFDSEWSDLQSMGPIHFTSLPPGTYKLEIELHSPLVGAGPKQSLTNIKVLTP